MSEIKITGFFIIKEPTTSVVATAKIELYSTITFMVRVIKGSNGFFVGYPNVWDKEKSKFVESIYIEKEFKNKIQKEVVDKYNLESSSKPLELKKDEIPQNSDLDDDDDIPF